MPYQRIKKVHDQNQSHNQACPVISLPVMGQLMYEYDPELLL